MSIIGLTDKAAALPVVGTLRKGEKKIKENAPGKDLTYFRFVSDDRLANKMFDAAYPNEESLRTINVYLPYKTAAENFDAWIEEWVAGGLVHRCDGQTQVLYQLPGGGYGTDPRPCKNCKGKQVGRLSVIIPELGRFATVTVMTTSKHDIMKLTSQLAAYEALSGGELRGVPFTLCRRLEKVSTPGPDGKRLRREKWLLSIETQPRWSIAKLTALEQAALPAVASMDEDDDEPLSLPAGVPNANPFEDADFEPVEPEPAKPTNGRALMEPEVLAAKLDEMVARSTLKDPETQEYLPGSLHPLGDKAVKLVVRLFRIPFESPDEAPSAADEKYHTSLEWLTGADTSHKLTAAQVDALLFWLLGKVAKKNLDDKKMDMKAAFRLAPSTMVIEEAGLIYDVARHDKEQLEAAQSTDQPTAETEQEELPL